jgi:diketogulonate reductase-like aldo/keto reductase
MVPIPGTTKLHRMKENTAAADLRLAPRDLDEITAAADQIDLAGDRHPEQPGCAPQVGPTGWPPTGRSHTHISAA